MLINLSELLSNDGEARDYKATIDMDCFECRSGKYEIVDKNEFTLHIANVGKRKLSVDGECTLSLNIPCDRCLEDVKTDISFPIEKTLDLSESDSDGIEVEEIDLCDGNNLDVDRLVHTEILMHLPYKTLCRQDCKGLCPSCGCNLNEGDCGCVRESLDPRMSVIQDIFKQFKEV